MKSCLIILILTFAFSTGQNVLQAQILMSDLNPLASVTQELHNTKIHIEYSRPNVRGRVIFGNIVPYGKIWSLSEKGSTTITFTEDVILEDQYKITSGSYALHAIPGKDEWTIIFLNQTLNQETADFINSSDIKRFKVKPQRPSEQVETFTIQFANVCSSCAEIQILWDYVKVGFRISTLFDEQVLSGIDEFTSTVENRMAVDYYVSAMYYLETNRDLDKAMLWINKSLEYEPESYWVIHTKAEIQAKLGDYKAAIKTAQHSSKLAKKANDKEFVNINDQEIERWKGLLKKKRE